MQPNAKLYILVDEKLPPGLQMAQVAHAAFDLSLTHRALLQGWHRESNYVVVLASSDLVADINRVLHNAAGPTYHVTVFEPDLPGEPMTAVAFVPAPWVGPALACLPLAGKVVELAT